MTSASTESGMPRLSGKTLPLRKANSAPATPATVPAMTKAVHCMRLASMPMASLRRQRIARRPQRIAERREHDDAQGGDRERGDAERQPVETRRPRRPFRRPDAENAVVAAGHLDPLERDRPDDLREGQRQHREIDAGQSHAEPAEHRGAETAQQRAEQQRRRSSASPPSWRGRRRHRRRARNRRRGRTRRARRPTSGNAGWRRRSRRSRSRSRR